MISLEIQAAFTVPVEAETITPDAFAGKSVAEVERMPVQQGNRTAALADFFTVRGEPDDRIEVSGDCSRVKYLGRGMTHGWLTVVGEAGMHTGAEMRGGELHVRGHVGDWAGAEMRGGLLRVAGNAGHLLGAGYRGSLKGMRGGTILVEGRAGNEVGAAMRRGLIAVGGGAGDFAAVMMLAGSVFVFGSLGIRAGAGMKRGTLVVHSPDGAAGPPLLPTFRFGCEYRPTWLGLYERALHAWGFPLPPEGLGGRYRRYSGDLADLGKGELLLWTSR